MDEAQWTQVVGERAAPEYMEVLFFRLSLMTLLRLGVSLMTNICTNKRRSAPDKVGDQNLPGAHMDPNLNPTGLERDPNGFLGETGARVMDVQHTGNLLGMLLQSTRDGSYRVLTWTFEKGCALDWFPSKPTEENGKPTEENGKPTEENGKPTEETEKPTGENGKPTEEREKPSTHPGSYFERVRSQMAFWFCFANLLGGGKEVLAQIDFSNSMNQADWSMYTVPGDFDFSKGWFDTFSGNVSILDQPSVWMRRVREDFERRVVTDPDLPAVVWMGERLGAIVWKGIGCLSKSEILNRFWKSTGVGVFVTLGELKLKRGRRGEDRLNDLCLAAIMFLRSQAWAGK